MKINDNFTKPKNEATVKLYTDVSEKSLGIEPKFFYPRTSLRVHITRYCENYLTQFILHSQK